MYDIKVLLFYIMEVIDGIYVMLLHIICWAIYNIYNMHHYNS